MGRGRLAPVQVRSQALRQPPSQIPKSPKWQPNGKCPFLALKALVLERMGKPDEALEVCLDAKELLFSSICSIQLQDFGADIVDCMNFAIFVNAWDSCSHHWKLPNRDGCNLNSWHIVDSLVRTCITEQLKCSQPILTSPGSNLPVLLQLVTESLSWHTLVIQSCLRSMVPHGKKKKKSAMDQSDSPHVKAIRATIECLISSIKGVHKCLADQIVGQEDEKLDVLLSHVKGKELQDGPGCVFQALEDYGAANHSECGERISILEFNCSTDVLRKFTGSQKSLLSRFHGICDTKLKLLVLRGYCSNNLLVHFLAKFLLNG